MDGIPQDLIDRMMVKCGRRCCICRRFRPTLLQAHHIVERSQGGADDEDNLIVTCLTCHVDVHSRVPFARRFTPEELKGHREALIGIVAEGVLPADEPDNTVQLIGAVIASIGSRPAAPGGQALSREAVEILLGAAHATGNCQGRIGVYESLDGFEICPGDRDSPYKIDNARAVARYKAALKELEAAGLIEYTSESLREVTDRGYLAADEIASEHGQSLNPE